MSKHGITILEQATSISPPVTASAALPVYIGTAPVHRTANPAAAVQRVIVAYSYAEAVTALGYSDAWGDWTLCEAMNAQFRQFGVAPAIFINVFNPSEEPTDATAAVPVVNGRAILANDKIILASVAIEDAVKDTDYTVAAIDGGIAITPIAGAALAEATSLDVSYKTVDPTAVTAADILGGVDENGVRTGIELMDTIFPRLRLVPGLLAAPGWDSVEVAQALTAKARNINSLFKTVAVVDVPESEAITSYQQVPAWKESNGLSSGFTFVCWPRVTLGSKTFHLSAQLCGLMGRTDYANGDIPFHSPSNQALQMDGMVWHNKEVVLDMGQANYLGDNGIVTALNWIGGWRAWGNRTCAYPSTTDPKDVWIPVRRMINWVSNSIVLSYWRRIDLPIRRVLIDDICTSINMWFKGLVTAGALLGGRIEFLPADNLSTAIMDGKIKFRVYICPPIPAQEIEFVLEYDPAYLDLLAA